MAKSRRYFLKHSALCATGLAIGGYSTLNGCTPTTYINYTKKGDRIVVSKSKMEGHKYVLLNTQDLPASIYLGKKEKEGYIAILLECTHKNCELQAFNNKFSCPCHGSKFNNKGKVINGPATENLKTFKVEEDEKNIYIG